MYLRTTKRRNADGSEVCYYQLADNVWDPQRKCSVAKVVYNFGRADEVDAEKMRRLAGSILRVFGDPTEEVLINVSRRQRGGARRHAASERFTAQRVRFHRSSLPGSRRATLPRSDIDQHLLSSPRGMTSTSGTRGPFVGDAGMNSEENRKSLGLGNGKYILGAKMRANDEVTREVLARPGRYKEVKDNLRVKTVVVGDGERRRRYVVCHNPDEETRQRAHREKVLVDLAAELETLRERPDGTHTTRAHALLTSGRFKRYLRQVGTGSLAIDRSAVKDAERYDGKWVITSNDDTLTAEDLALGYKQLLRVEACWRTLKSGLQMRPVFHYRPWRIQAHVGLAVLALLLERIVEIRAGDTWRNIRATLESIKVVEYERDGVRVRQTTDLRPEAAALLRKLKVDPPPKLHAAAAIPAAGEPKAW